MPYLLSYGMTLHFYRVRLYLECCEGANVAVPARACGHFGAVRQRKRATNVPVSSIPVPNSAFP